MMMMMMMMTLTYGGSKMIDILPAGDFLHSYLINISLWMAYDQTPTHKGSSFIGHNGFTTEYHNASNIYC